MSSDRNGTLAKIADLLANGLLTQTEPFPETDKEFARFSSNSVNSIRTISRENW